MLKKLLSVGGFIIILIAGAIGGVIGKGIGKAAFSPEKLSPQEVEAKLIEGFTIGAKKINQQSPITVDKDTRLDRATVGPGTRLVYHYTLVKFASSDIDANLLLTNLRPEIKNKLCSSKEMKLSLQYGGTYVYSYSGSDGAEVTKFEIDRDDCGFPKISP